MKTWVLVTSPIVLMAGVAIWRFVKRWGGEHNPALLSLVERFISEESDLDEEIHENEDEEKLERLRKHARAASH